MNTLILLLFCIGASIVQRVTGFGFGIFIMTILPYLLPSYGEATTLSGILAATLSFFVMIKMRKFIVWKHISLILLFFMFTSYVSIYFVSSVTDSSLKKILGVALILMSIYFFFFSEKIKISPTKSMQVFMGSLSGIMGGLFAMQGPPAVLYFLASAKDKNEYMSMTQTYFFIGNIFMTIVRAKNGLFTNVVCLDYFYALAGLAVGGILGKYIYDKISAVLLRRIVYVYMAISGVVAILN